MIGAQAEPIPARSIYNGALGGAIAAAVGAAVWGLIVWLTDYEIGFAAVGIGLLVAWAVYFASGRRKGLPLQVVAVLEAVAGVLVGKYLAVWLVIRDFLGGDLALTDPLIFALITEEPGAVFSLFDLLWFGLAVYAAWRFLAPEPPAITAPASTPGSATPQERPPEDRQPPADAPP